MRKMGSVLISIGVICLIAGIMFLCVPSKSKNISNSVRSNQSSAISSINNGEDKNMSAKGLSGEGYTDKTREKNVECGNYEQSEGSNKKTTNKEIGNEFENTVANLFSDRGLFTVLEWNQGQTSSQGVYAENDKNPDFKIKQVFKKSGLTYWVECKYRSKFTDKGFIKISDYQLVRYRGIQGKTHIKIFLAIGVGNSPSKPEKFYLIPLDSVNKEYIHSDILERYKMDLSGNSVYNWIDWYFENEVFAKSKRKKKE